MCYIWTVVQEINDREQFLNDMESIGQGEKYRQIIQTEISQVIYILWKKNIHKFTEHHF